MKLVDWINSWSKERVAVVLTVCILILLMALMVCSAHSEEFRLISVEAHGPQPDTVIVPVCIGIGVLAAGYGVYRVLVHYCEKYYGTNTNKTTMSLNLADIEPDTNRVWVVRFEVSPGTGEPWSQWACVTSTLPVARFHTNFSRGALYRASVE